MAFRKLPKKVILQNNKELAANYIGPGESLLNIVESQAGFRGLQQYVLRRVLRDGSVIEASICHGMSFVKIWSPFAPMPVGVGEEEVKFCWEEIFSIEGATLYSAFEKSFVVKKDDVFWWYTENDDPDIPAPYIGVVLPSMIGNPILANNTSIYTTNGYPEYRIKLLTYENGVWSNVFSESTTYKLAISAGKYRTIGLNRFVSGEYYFEIWSCVNSKWAKVWEAGIYWGSVTSVFSLDGRTAIITYYDDTTETFKRKILSCVNGEWDDVASSSTPINTSNYEYKVSANGKTVWLCENDPSIMSFYMSELWSCANGYWVNVASQEAYYRRYALISNNGKTALIINSDAENGYYNHQVWSCVGGSWQKVVEIKTQVNSPVAILSNDGRTVCLRYQTDQNVDNGDYSQELWSCATGEWTKVATYEWHSVYNYTHIMSADGRTALIYYRASDGSGNRYDFWSCVSGSWVNVAELNAVSGFTFLKISSDGRTIVFYPYLYGDDVRYKLLSYSGGAWVEVVYAFDEDYVAENAPVHLPTKEVNNSPRFVLDLFNSTLTDPAMPEGMCCDKHFTVGLDLMDDGTEAVTGADYITPGDVPPECRRRRAVMALTGAVAVIKRTEENDKPCQQSPL